MSDPMKHAWRDVEDGFSSLGRMMRERYQGATEDDPEPCRGHNRERRPTPPRRSRDAFDRASSPRARAG